MSDPAPLQTAAFAYLAGVCTSLTALLLRQILEQHTARVQCARVVLALRAELKVALLNRTLPDLQGDVEQVSELRRYFAPDEPLTRQIQLVRLHFFRHLHSATPDPVAVAQSLAALDAEEHVNLAEVVRLWPWEDARPRSLYDEKRRDGGANGQCAER